ncbi:MAG: sulfite exporter TauE/SafE family protein [Gammaproteobacteria bacterium]|nr:sulfite exporter TauE/SafE family protein [Gammaproteobacteria bacterium]
MKIRSVELSDSELSQEHAALGLPPVEEVIVHPGEHPILRAAVWFTGIALLLITIFLLARLFYPGNTAGGWQAVEATLLGKAFWIAVAVGFFAQVIDGALGMAYGITATTFLLSTGASPALASASVHMAEIFTTGFSGIAHAKLGNVNKALFGRLLIPGIVGTLIGVAVVTQVDGKVLKPYISAYLLLMGIYILSKAWRKLQVRKEPPKHVAKLALFGGFVDAAGGGGWGPVVTTTLISSGHDPRTTIGSVNFAEFFLTLTGAAAFAAVVGSTAWPLVMGLVFGGLFAAPFAAVLCSKVSARTLLILVGVIIAIISTYNLYRAFA